MSTAKNIFEFYINSSVHVSLAVVSLTFITYLNLGIPIEKSLLIFIFFGTVTGYNFVKYAGVAKLHHSSLTKSLKIIQIFSLICFLGLLISTFYIPLEILLWAGFFAVFTLLYALPVFSRHRNLRSFSGIKIFIIAIVWAGVTVILPVTGAENFNFENSVLEFLQRFLLVLVLILPFEIRDLKYDLQYLRTIPQRVGVTPTKILGLVTLVFLLVLEFFKNSAMWESKIAIGLLAIITGVLLWRSKENQSRYYASFWVEGVPVFWLLVLLLLRSL